MTDTTDAHRMSRIRFDGTINLGHVLTILTLLSAGFVGYLSIEVRIHELDLRTADYASVRDEVKSSSGQITSLRAMVNQQGETLRAAVADQAMTNRQTTQAISDLRSDVAAVTAVSKAVLEAIQRQPRTP